MNKNAHYRILVADDDAFCQGSLAKLLITCGYSVSMVTTAADAIAELKSGQFDLGVVDYHMSSGSGRRLVEQLRDESVHVPFIIVTGDVSAETERAARSLSPVFYFVKPFEPADLKAVVERILERTVLV